MLRHACGYALANAGHDTRALQAYSIALAQRIVRTFPGVSLDWLYLGRPEGLSCEIAEKLGYGAAHSQPGAAEQKTSLEPRNGSGHNAT
jgi:hypothetical protein